MKIYVNVKNLKLLLIKIKVKIKNKQTKIIIRMAKR